MLNSTQGDVEVGVDLGKNNQDIDDVDQICYRI